MSISFTLDLREDDWKEQVRGWSCQVLAIPGATVEALYARSVRVDSTWYQVDTPIAMIKWIHDGQPPASATVQITLTKDLEDRDISSLWKKLAIVLPVAASVVVAFITVYYQRTSIPPRPPPLHQSFTTWTVTGSLALGKLSRYQVVPSIKPPLTEINDDGTFQFEIPMQTRTDGSAIPPTMIFSPVIPGYSATVVHLEKDRSLIIAEDYGPHYDDTAHVITLTKAIPIKKAP
jgi:hypothetical protein